MKRCVRVSILVPIYDVEKFLPECLDSLVGQTLKEIEIICINDGSTDSSFEIMKEYSENDDRIRIIDKKNTGYGDSMNEGLAAARGEYIGIVEPDDFVKLDTFEKMYNNAKKKNAEIVKANFYEYTERRKNKSCKSHLFLKDEVGRVIDPKKHRHIFYQQPSIWSAIYKRDFLNKNSIKFLPSGGASYQDAGFNFKVFAMASRVLYVDEAFLYYRCDNPNSSVKSEGKIYAVKDEYDEVEKYLKKQGVFEEFARTLAIVRMGGYIWNMRRLTNKAATEFGQEVKNKYGAYQKAGYLNTDGLEDDAKFIVNNLAIRDPDRFVKVRFLYEFNDMMKIKLLGLYKGLIKRRSEK